MIVISPFATLKPVASGYVLRTVGPWIFGPPRHYSVTEAEKTLLVPILVNRHPVRGVVLATLALLGIGVSAALLVWAFGSGRDNPGPGDLAAILVLVVGAMYLALLAAARVTLRRLRGALPELRPTDLRITAREIQESAATATSPKLLAFITLSSAFTCLVILATLAFDMLHRTGGFEPRLLVQLPCSAIFGTLALVNARRWYRRRAR